MSADRWAISELLFQYAEGCDTKDYDLASGVFTADGIGEYGEIRISGAQRLREFLASCLENCGVTQHLLTNVVIHPADETATARYNMRAWHQGIGQWEGSSYEVFGYYEDQLVSTAAGWRITHKRLTVTHHLGVPQLLGPLDGWLTEA